MLYPSLERGGSCLKNDMVLVGDFHDCYQIKIEECQQLHVILLVYVILS